MNLCVKSKYFKPNFISSLYRFSTSASEEAESLDHVLIDDTDYVQAKEAEINKKRNISRLTPAHYNLVNGKRPYETPLISAHMTVKYNRKLYGKYGAESGVNPSLCWPTREEIKEKQEYEEVAYPFTIREMMDTAAQNRREEQLRIEQREKEVVAKFEKLGQWKKELKDRIHKKESQANAAKEKKERLVEEVRRHFGFKMDPRDERFQEMLAKREKEQKKAEKKAKQDAKDKVMLAKLQQQSMDLDAKS